MTDDSTIPAEEEVGNEESVMIDVPIEPTGASDVPPTATSELLAEETKTKEVKAETQGKEVKKEAKQVTEEDLGPTPKILTPHGKRDARLAGKSLQPVDPYTGKVYKAEGDRLLEAPELESTTPKFDAASDKIQHAARLIAGEAFKEVEATRKSGQLDGNTIARLRSGRIEFLEFLVSILTDISTTEVQK